MPQIYTKISTEFVVEIHPEAGTAREAAESLNNFRGEPGQRLCELDFKPPSCLSTSLGIGQYSIHSGFISAMAIDDRQVKIECNGVFKVAIRKEFLDQAVEDKNWYFESLNFNSYGNQPVSGLEKITAKDMFDRDCEYFLVPVISAKKISQLK